MSVQQWHGDEEESPLSVQRGVSHLSGFVRKMCCKQVASFGHNLWPQLLIMGCCSLPCEANEVCDQTELPVNTLSLHYLCLCNWCTVMLIKPKSYSNFLNVTENPLSHLIFSFYFQVSVLFWDNFAFILTAISIVTAIFSKLEFFLLKRLQSVCHISWAYIKYRIICCKSK